MPKAGNRCFGLWPCPQVEINVPPALVLNQVGVAAITVKGSGSPKGIIGASINSTSIGASTVQGSTTENLNVINSLSAF